MPKAPILNREGFYDKLSDGSFRLLDWNLVNTNVGACVEPRQIRGVDGGKLVQADAKDGSFSKLSEMDEDQLYRLLGTGGQQVPTDYNV